MNTKYYKNLLYIPTSSLCKEDIAYYKKKLTICLDSVYSFKYLELYRIAIVNDIEYLIVPREIDLINNSNIVDSNNYIEYDFRETRDIMTSKYALRDYQVNPVNEVLNKLNNKQSGILECPAGGGKTNMAIWIAQHLNLKTLFIADQYELLEQAYERFVEFGGFKPNVMSSSWVENNNSGVTLSLFQSLAKNEKLLNYCRENYGLLIVDECHISSANTYNEVISSIQGLRLGLTATNRRKDNLDFIYKMHLGETLAKVNVEMLKCRVYWVKYDSKQKFEPNPYQSNLNTAVTSLEMANALQSFNIDLHSSDQNDSYQNLVKKVLTDNDRNNIISNIINKYQDRRILLISANIEHIEYMSSELNCLRIPNSKIHSKQNKKTNEKNLTDFKAGRTNVLLTVNKANKGMDIADLDLLILCIGGNNDVYWEQRVGRIQRIKENKKKPIVIDFSDQKCDMFRNMARNRAKFYGSKQFEQKIIEHFDIENFLKEKAEDE